MKPDDVCGRCGDEHHPTWLCLLLGQNNSYGYNRPVREQVAQLETRIAALRAGLNKIEQNGWGRQVARQLLDADEKAWA